MTDISKVKLGDRVKVTVEGVVTYVSDSGPEANFDLGDTEFYGNELQSEGGTIQVEVIPPPVETFGSGDIVRSKRAPGYVFAIGWGGTYMDMLNGSVVTNGEPFTSEHFERVTL